LRQAPHGYNSEYEFQITQYTERGDFILTMSAVVLVSYGSQGIVELDGGERLGCKYRRSVGRPYCGDRVEIQPADGQSAVVTRILPRDNVFVRADSRQHKQIVAANLSQVLVIIAPRPEPSRDLVERYLVAIHSLGILPVIVLNKAELVQHGGFDRNGPLGRLDDYRKLGYEVLHTSCKTTPGIAALNPILENSSSILVGQSGVGKSSLINCLLPDLELQTGALSRVTGKGVHTTTTNIMYSMPSGGRLIDSPGVWEYGLWRMEQQELVDGFPEFQPFLGHCKFNDCHHEVEPQCAIRLAAEQGTLFSWRYQAYLRLLAQST
jgi:ribosome biogenesis GTPase